MFVCAVDEALIDVRELHDDLILLFVAQCIVIKDVLVELGFKISNVSTGKATNLYVPALRLA